MEEGYIYATAKDVSIEKRLRELNQQSRILAKIGSWEIDLVKQTLFWSDEVHQMHETDPNTFEPDVETDINFYREDFREKVKSAIENCISTAEPFDFEAVLVTTSHKEIWARVLGNAEFLDGKCIRIYGSFQDINAVKETENRLISTADNLPGVIYQYVMYPDGRDAMQHVSGNVEQLWGYSKEEVINNVTLLWDQIRLGGEIEKVQNSIKIAIETDSKWTCRFKTVIKNGELRTHLGNGTPTFLSDGSIVFNVIILDVTNEAKNEELLKQTSQIARLGSWEMDLLNQTTDNMYWSPVVWDILELDKNYNPTLTGGIELNIGESRTRIELALNRLLQEGIEFEEEILMRTGKGNERWFKSTGKSERVNNVCTKIYGSFQDIHQSKMAELELINAKEKAEASDAKFKAYTEQSTTAIYTTNTNGDCIYANENWLKIAGMTMAEAQGKGWINALHPEDLKEVQNNWYKSVKSNGKWSYEYRFINKKGKINWVNGTAKGLYNEVNELVGYLGTNINITDQKKAEQEKYNLQTTLENSLNEIYIFDADTFKFTYANKGALLNLGYSKKEILKITPIDIKPNYTLEQFKELVSTLITKQEKKIIFFTNHQRKNKSIYPVEVHLQLVKENDNKRFLAVVLDISERKKAELKLVESEQQYRTLAGQLQLEQTHLANAQKVAKIGSWETNLKDFTVTWSNETYRIFGIENDGSEMTHEKFLRNVHPLDREKVDKALGNSLSDTTKNFHFIEHRILTKKGEEKIVEERWEIDFDHQGNPLIAVGSCQDITERKKAEETLRESELKFKSVFDSKMVGIMFWDENGTISDANEKFLEMIDYSIQDFQEKNLNWHDITLSEYLEIDKNALKQLKNAGTCVPFEKEYLRKDGSRVHVLIGAAKLGHNGVMTGVAYIADISTRKKVEMDLLKANERFEKVTEATNDAIWDWDILKNTFFRSKAIERFFGGTTLQTLVGTYPPEQLHIV
jgi:PAS domain S-box-containing protein